MENPGTPRSSYPYDTTRVTEFLKSKRRVRPITSCFPCRHRKVKCDGNFPCRTCVSRGHPEVCCAPSESNGSAQFASIATNDESLPGQQHSTEANDAEDTLSLNAPGNNSNTQNSPSQSNIGGIDLMLRRLEAMESQISALRTELQHNRTALAATPDQNSHLRPARDSGSRSSAQSLGRNFVEESTGATIFLGNHSDPPAALGCRRVRDTIVPDTLLLEQVMPRTYPFTNLWGPDTDAAEVCGTLPDDSNIIRYWQIYQTSAYPFYPALVQHQEFNDLLFKFLDQRAEAQLANETLKAQDLDASWLGLLFAVLACGVQFSDDPVKERDLQSKVFVCSSFQCLRLSDFFTNTDMNHIQAMALIGHCLRNNLDANTAWILMGTTLRLAQSIGLHEVTSPQESSSTVLNFQKRRLWWMLIWQDVFLSFTYDRSSSLIKLSSSIPYEDESRAESGNCSYSECICTLIQIILERAREEPVDIMAATMGYKKRMESILTEAVAAPFLIHKSRCRTLQDHLERLALRVHVCYGITRLCRLMLEMPSNASPVSVEGIKRECIARATDAVEAFLDMHRLSSLVCRTWAFVHNAVSCAFALQNLGAAVSQSSRSSALVHRLVAVLESEEVQATWQDLDTNVRYFGPYSRASKALKEAIASRAHDS